MPFPYGSLMLGIGIIPSGIACFLSAFNYFRTRYPHFAIMSLTWFLLTLSTIFLTFSYLLLDFTFYRLGIFINVGLLYSIIFLVDTISQQKVDPLKIFVATIPGTATIVYGFNSDSVKLTTSALGERHPTLVGMFLISAALVFLISGTYWLYYMVKIYYLSPASIKKYAKINLIGAVIAGPGAAFSFASGLVWVIPGTDYLLIGIGSLLCTYSFHKEPKLGYVLPFKVYYLLVIDVKSSIPLYKHEWAKTEELDPILFSGALQAVSSILDESLRQGIVREMIFDKARLVIHHTPGSRIVHALVTSKSNDILRYGLALFDSLFREEYRTELAENITMVSQFEHSRELVEKAFPFVLEHD